MTDFTHLHTHSYYSLLDGTLSVPELVRIASRLGFKHLALTDHNALYGAVEFYRRCGEAGIHPVIGAEVTLTDGFHLILLVKNRQGYRHLCRLLSLGHLRGGHLKFQLALADVLRFRRGLICLSGGQKGQIYQLIRRRRLEAAQQLCRRLKTAFGPDFYLELQQFEPNDLLLNMRLRDLAHSLDIGIVATNDVHFAAAEDHSLRRALHAIDQNTLFTEVKTAGSAQQYLKSADEMAALFRHFPRALDSTMQIARRCRFEFSLGKPIFPAVDLPKGESAYSYLWKSVFNGARRRYRPLTPKLIKRLNHEVNTINNLGFSDYFLIVKDIVDFCRREGIPCVGRGSAGDSVVSYVLGITQVDPLRYNLYFERFLNPDRADPPDIDLDICWKNRGRVLDYIYRKYGKGRTAMICTFNTFQLRSSLRDVARIFGFPEDEISAVTKYLPHFGAEELFRIVEQVPECRHLRAQLDLFRQVVAMARRLADFPRHQSIHPGGVLIAPDNITDFSPLQVAGNGIVVSHFDMYSIEPLGLVKMDILGVRSLSIVTDCLKAVTEIYEAKTKRESVAGKTVPADDGQIPAPPSGELNLTFPVPMGTCTQPAEKPPARFFRFDVARKKIVAENSAAYLTPERFPFLGNRQKHLSPLDLRMIPDNDSNVIALLRAGLSMGCFQMESPGMRGLLRKMQIDGVDDVITAVALIRPGAANSGAKEVYIQRRGGLAETEYLHPALRPVLEETYGVIIYQEQVMRVAAEVAGLSLAQADVLRKAMTKARTRKTLLGIQSGFLEGARKRGLNRVQAEEIWKFLANFVGYGFNKAHSATYGVIAYQTAFLKHYFPVQYMTAVLNNYGGFYSTAAYVEECRRMGIRLLPPDINRSEIEFSSEGDSILVGLNSVFQLTEATRKRIIAARRQAPFRDYYDFVLRARPREEEAANLIKCGALRSLHPNEPLTLLRNKFFFKYRRNRNISESLLRNVHLPPYSAPQRILYEMEILNFAVTDHPLRLFESKIDWSRHTPSTELEKMKGRPVEFYGWLVTSRRVATRSKKYMKFLTLEDRSGLCEAVMFPEVYNRYGHLTRGQGPYHIRGTVQSRLPGEANLIVQELELIEMNREELEQAMQTTC